MTEPGPSDERLLADVRAGDRRALEALLERHQAQIYRFGMRMCRDPGAAPTLHGGTMTTVQATENNFEATVKKGIALLAFWATGGRV